MLLMIVGGAIAIGLAYYILPKKRPDFLPPDQRVAFVCLVVAACSFPLIGVGAASSKSLQCTSKAQGLAIIVSNPFMACKK